MQSFLWIPLLTLQQPFAGLQAHFASLQVTDDALRVSYELHCLLVHESTTTKVAPALEQKASLSEAKLPSSTFATLMYNTTQRELSKSHGSVLFAPMHHGPRRPVLYNLELWAWKCCPPKYQWWQIQWPMVILSIRLHSQLPITNGNVSKTEWTKSLKLLGTKCRSKRWRLQEEIKTPWFLWYYYIGLQGGLGQNNLISSGLKIGSSSQSAPGLERDSLLNTVWGVPPWRWRGWWINCKTSLDIVGAFFGPLTHWTKPGKINQQIHDIQPKKIHFRKSLVT